MKPTSSIMEAIGSNSDSRGGGLLMKGRSRRKKAGRVVKDEHLVDSMSGSREAEIGLRLMCRQEHKARGSRSRWVTRVRNVSNET